MLSDVVESLCLSVKEPFEIISAEDLLARVDEFNREIAKERRQNPDYDWREEFILLGTDVKALFPSMSAERSGRAVRQQVEKSKIVWEEVDDMWLSLYVHLNEKMCSNIDQIKYMLPKRRRGRRGPEAGMGSDECKEREIYDDDDSNWEWPIKRSFTGEEKSLLMGAAMQG